LGPFPPPPPSVSKGPKGGVGQSIITKGGGGFPPTVLKTKRGDPNSPHRGPAMG